MRHLVTTWLVLLALSISFVSSQNAIAQQTRETVAAHGRWTGELRFKRHGQQDAVCKLAVTVRNYRIKDNFDCPRVWWLVPGFQWSIVGRIDPAGTLTGASIMWGQESYAELSGTLRQARGRFSEQISYGTIRSTAGGDAVLALRPEAGAAKSSKSTGSASKPSASATTMPASTLSRYDGRYAGKGLCRSIRDAGEVEFQADITVQNGKVDASITMLLKIGRDHDRYTAAVDDLGLVRIPIRYGAIIELRLAEDPPIFEIANHCDFPMTKSKSAPSGEHGAVSAGNHDGAYFGKGFCTSAVNFTSVELEVESHVSAGRATVRITKRTKGSGAGVDEFKGDVGDVGEDGTIRVEGAYNAQYVLKLAGEPNFESVGQCKFPMTKTPGPEQPKTVVAAAAAAVHDGIYSGANNCTGALGGSSDYSPYQLRITATVVGGRADILFRATGRANTENRYDFSAHLSDQGVLNQEVKSGEIWTFRFGDDQPVAKDRDYCVVRLNRESAAKSQSHGTMVKASGPMKFEGTWQNNIDRVSRNVSLNDVVVDENGVITQGTFWSDGATDLNCSFMAIAVDGRFDDNVLTYSHDNGCGEITTTVTFDGDVGVGEWRQDSLRGTIELTRK